MFGKSGWIKILAIKFWRMNGSAKSLTANFSLVNNWWFAKFTKPSPIKHPHHTVQSDYFNRVFDFYYSKLIGLSQSVIYEGRAHGRHMLVQSCSWVCYWDKLIYFNNLVANLAILLLLLYKEQVNNNSVTRAHTQT